jgi:HAMP domain-containing protein
VAREKDRDSADAGRIAVLLQRAKEALTAHMLEWGQNKTMVEGTVAYNVVFTGKLTLDEAQVIANVASFFKLGNSNAQRLLQPERILKTYQSKMQADKLARLLTRAGAECRVEMEESSHDEPTSVQKMALALQDMEIPVVQLPDYRRFGWREWVAIGAACGLALLIGVWLALRPLVIHGTTLAEYQASVERLAEHAGPEHAATFRRAVDMVTEPARNAQNASASTDPVTAARLIYAAVEGKTADEVLALAKIRLEKQRAAYQKGIAEADEKIAVINQQLADIAPGNAVVLQKIEIVSAAFGWPPNASAPVLAFKIHNNSSETLMHLYLQGYLYDENGTLLVSNPVTYAVANGIAPGKLANVALPVSADSPWAIPAVRGKTGLVFRLRVANAENLQGRSLGEDYRPLETDRERHLNWKNKVQAQLETLNLE